MKLKRRAALVTGGGRGIGRACALALARAGADIAITYRRDQKSAESTCRVIQAIGRTAVAIECDVADEGHVKRAVKEAVEALGKLDILVCNAGIASKGNTIRDTTTEEMRSVLDTHLMGSFWCARHALDHLRGAEQSHIILVSSVATKHMSARTGPYTVAKAGIEALMHVLCKEEGPNGVRVNTIGPGLVETEMGKRLAKAHGTDNIKDLYKTYPFGRVAQPEDIGNLAAFLCSEEGSYISGQVIYVDGGGFHRRGEDILDK